MPTADISMTAHNPTLPGKLQRLPVYMLSSYRLAASKVLAFDILGEDRSGHILSSQDGTASAPSVSFWAFLKRAAQSLVSLS